MRILVTGGAGYIGAHVVKVFQEHGHDLIVYDDLTNSGNQRVIALKTEFVEGSIRDAAKLYKALHKIDLVIHCAAYKSVEESEKNPAKYHEINYYGTNTLLNEMVKANVNNLIFSSTAAVYGNSVTSPISESEVPQPISVYGATKLKAEGLITNYVKNSNINAVSLRYFNAVGSTNSELADTSKDNLFPKVFSAIDSGHPAVIFGDDYPTPDGTCIRDYIHVLDVAESHLKVWEYMQAQNAHAIFNVGTGKGYSVKEIIDGIKRITKKEFEVKTGPRRLGDLDIAYADVSKINHQTGWRARFDLDQMISSAWQAWESK